MELKVSRPAKAAVWKPLSGLAALAACLCLVFFGYYRPNFTAYGTLRIQINPDLEMTVSQTDRVLDLDWDVIGYVDPNITVNIWRDSTRTART